MNNALVSPQIHTSEAIGDVTAWLDSIHSHIDEYDTALARQHGAARRLARARDALDEATAELYGESAIAGRNKEERDACLHRLTAGERFELREAEEELAECITGVEHARNLMAKDRQTRYALQVTAMLRATEHPLEAAFERLSRGNRDSAASFVEFERAG